MAGKHYEQLELGRIFQHEIRRTLKEMDNILYD